MEMWGGKVWECLVKELEGEMVVVCGVVLGYWEKEDMIVIECDIGLVFEMGIMMLEEGVLVILWLRFGLFRSVWYG